MQNQDFKDNPVALVHRQLKKHHFRIIHKTPIYDKTCGNQFVEITPQVDLDILEKYRKDKKKNLKEVDLKFENFKYERKWRPSKTEWKPSISDIKG